MSQTVLASAAPIDIITKFVAAANAVNGTIFLANRSYKVVAAQWIHATAETTAATLTVDVTKETGTAGPASGSSVLSGTFNAKATANTGQSATSTATLAAGDRLSAKFSAAATQLAGAVLAVQLLPF